MSVASAIPAEPGPGGGDLAAAPAAQPEPEPEVLYLWPCNVQAWDCWLAVQTQWRSGMGGPTGLDYSSVHTYLHAVRNLRGQALRDVFAGIQAAERATLEVWAERRERDEQQQPHHPQGVAA